MAFRILVIDSDPATTELRGQLLKKHNFDIFMANNSEEGVRLVREIFPDVVVLDLVGPEADDWQICKEIRSFSRVPILILSTLNSPGMAASALDAGADDFLVKPVPSSVLIAHLNTFTRRVRSGKGNKSSLETTIASLLI
ncbi:MAG: response regulator [Chloroflexota bacterium]